MNSYIQETDSKMIFSQPADARLSFFVGSEDETIGGRSDSRFLPLPNENGLIRPALKVIRQLENKVVAAEARKVLAIIDETITTFQYLGFQFDLLPYLKAFNVEDGSILIEWIFNDFRMGFSIERSPNESSWYLITNSSLGEISASGYVAASNLKTLVLWLLNFVLSHS